MEIQIKYKIIIKKNEKDEILTFLSKFSDKNLPFNYRMEDVMYNIFYVTHEFTREYAQRFNIFPMIYYHLERYNEVYLTNEEMCNLVWMLGDLIDIINNDGSSILPEGGFTGENDALIEFIQLLHGIDSQQIIRDINKIDNKEILNDIVYFKSIKDNLIYFYEKLQSVTETQNSIYIHINKEDKEKQSKSDDFW